MGAPQPVAPSVAGILKITSHRQTTTCSTCPPKKPDATHGYGSQSPEEKSGCYGCESVGPSWRKPAQSPMFHLCCSCLRSYISNVDKSVRERYRYTLRDALLRCTRA